MPVTNEVVKEVLQSLDHKNDTIWTEDGAPLVGEIQRLTNDKTITRAQINDALPGFHRVLAVAVDDEAGNEPTESIGTDPNADITVKDTAPLGPDGFDPRIEPEVKGSGEPMSEEEVRAILLRRIRDAEQNIADCRTRLNDANHALQQGELRLNRTHADYQRKYPPITAAANIQSHLEAQGRLTMERHGLDPDKARSQVDVSMERSNRRGWTRPSRPVQNVA